MDFAERLVSLAYQSLGYFVVEGVPAGLNEADILAVKLDDAGNVVERLHVEVQISVRPIGVLRPRGALGTSAAESAIAAAGYIKKKYESPNLLKVTAQRFSGGDYRRIFVHGRLKDKTQLEVFREQDIECIPIGRLVQDAFAADPTNELKRQLLTAELLSITNP